MKEPANIDILFNIEHAILGYYRKEPNLRDQEVILVLENLINNLRARITKRPYTNPTLDDPCASLYSTILAILEMVHLDQDEQPKVKRFSRALREASAEEKVLAALRKVEKSAKRWTARNGQRGYLDFISNTLSG